MIEILTLRLSDVVQFYCPLLRDNLGIILYEDSWANLKLFNGVLHVYNGRGPGLRKAFPFQGFVFRIRH